MSVTCNPQFLMGVAETLETNVDAAVVKRLIHSGFDLTNLTLNATSTPPVTKTSFLAHALTAGAKTLDFTALPGSNGITHDCTGLKMQLLLIHNPTGNATLTVAPGSSNPYPPWGTAKDLDIPAGSYFPFIWIDTLPDCSATVKTLDFSGSGTQTFNLGVVFG